MIRIPELRNQPLIQKSGIAQAVEETVEEEQEVEKQYDQLLLKQKWQFSLEFLHRFKYIREQLSRHASGGRIDLRPCPTCFVPIEKLEGLPNLLSK